MLNMEADRLGPTHQEHAPCKRDLTVRVRGNLQTCVMQEFVRIEVISAKAFLRALPRLSEFNP